ncbi:MAG: CTP synthase [bacterium]|nr:CTP synthase [bacterium]
MNLIFITGGVISSLGKGIITASIASILEEIGFKLTVLKLDPYLNIDAGTMNPLEHGEVFVTFDGGETDLDIGHYERFTNINFSKKNNITSGQVYLNVLEKERKGEFLGQTIQVIPHVTNEIKKQIYERVKDFDLGIVEIGGTVGDIESLPFLEAARQIKIENPNTIFIHITYVPHIKNTGELKTKPTQHSVRELRSIGIQPDFIIFRTEEKQIIPKVIQDIKNKIALFSNLTKNNIIDIPNLKYTYLIPYKLLKNKFHKLLLKLLINKRQSRKLTTIKTEDSRWNKIKSFLLSTKNYKKFSLAIVGKYTKLKDSYKSLSEALFHSAIYNKINLNIKWVDSEKIEKDKQLSDILNVSGIIIAGGFGSRGIEGKLTTIKWARENDIPILGICLGLQLMFIEFCRNILGIKDANSREFISNSNNFVVELLENQKHITKLGGTMRLGNYKCKISPNTLAYQIYQSEEIEERHRHRYEINLSFLKQYQKDIEKNGLIISGTNPETKLVEIIEMKNKKFFLGVQFHPEFNSRIFNPHPIFNHFLSIIKNET